MKWLIPICIFCIGISTLWAQGTETFPKGARSMGMGNANATLSDVWSVFNNVGGLSRIDHSQVAFGYDHRLDLNELTTLAAALVFKRKDFGWGIGVSSYGSEYFSQQHFGLAISNQLGIASLGLKINYFQTSIEGFGTGRAAILEFGGIAELSPELFFGAHVYNPTRAKFGKHSPDHLPTVIKAGISYRPAEKLSVQLEAEKDIVLDPLLKLGLEYNLLNKIWGRMGINTLSSHLFFGIGFQGRTIHFDYAITQHPALGYTHHFSANVQLSKK
ncbi:hypothetical protein [Cecembia lonarensis]|uniref:Bacteroidetes-specific membrane protein n=1 Tax=Cecembia lonarensis (strain CCUG 58316 / KCTC 22772 / LW9) TaxID=1225176 RepID=K1M515_CECL9|nr:hypothetical protein [Cecembia lonarensis]EKB51284.1 hypothetical protein B879_00078 [Cecembia lonarensis LW9]